jgi:hypothetical protein
VRRPSRTRQLLRASQRERAFEDAQSPFTSSFSSKSQFFDDAMAFMRACCTTHECKSPSLLLTRQKMLYRPAHICPSRVIECEYFMRAIDMRADDRCHNVLDRLPRVLAPAYLSLLNMCHRWQVLFATSHEVLHHRYDDHSSKHDARPGSASAFGYRLDTYKLVSIH